MRHAFRRAGAGAPRITSYNVCYTKLLREASEWEEQISEEVKEDRWHRFMQVQQEISLEKMQAKVGVITSYSIHYTKLYDMSVIMILHL